MFLFSSSLLSSLPPFSLYSFDSIVYTREETKERRFSRLECPLRRGSFGCFDIVDLALLILTNDSQMQLHRVLCPCRKRPHKRALVSARLSTVRQRAAYLTHDARFLRRGRINHGNNFQPVSGIVQCNLTINPFTFVINYVV